MTTYGFSDTDFATLVIDAMENGEISLMDVITIAELIENTIF